jgi:hypothetical protein
VGRYFDKIGKDMFILMVWLVCPFIGGGLLSSYNRAGTGFLLGLFLGPIGCILAWAFRSEEKKKELLKFHEENLAAIKASQTLVERDEVECPFCAELVLKKALICKHCNLNLTKD